jgi:hypothetical protein
MSGIEQARQANLAKHWAERQERYAQRGPKGIAEAWWDRVKAVGTQRERAGDSEVWADLARALENFCARYEK